MTVFDKLVFEVPLKANSGIIFFSAILPLTLITAL